MQMKEFSGNVSHSSVDGLMFDRGPNAQVNSTLAGTRICPIRIQRHQQRQAGIGVQDFTSYKNSGAAIWARGENHVFKGLKLADSGIGYTHAYPGVARTRRLYLESRGLPVRGETDNKGTPKTEAEIAYGRSMPRKDADYPIRGYEYYDSRTIL